MNLAIRTKLFLLSRKIRFLLSPLERRVRLELETDGRHITFMLVSLHQLGYAVHVVASPMIFRELLCLRESLPIPFVIGGKSQACGLAINDSEDALARMHCPKKLLLDYDYFDPQSDTPRVPYFMHPSVYHCGLQNLPVPDPADERLIRIGFFGSRDAEFYTRDFHFPILNREQILESFLSEFDDRIWIVDQHVSTWKKREFAVSIDKKGGDRVGKNFLPMADYLAALRQCDFFLSPPGWCMPLSHNLIEGMAAGCIPILNYPGFLAPPLEDEVDCLSFESPQDVRQVIEKALGMPQSTIQVMRQNVMAYYAENLSPGRWLRNHLENSDSSAAIRVNAEEVSMGIRMPGVNFVNQAMNKARLPRLLERASGPAKWVDPNSSNPSQCRGH